MVNKYTYPWTGYGQFTHDGLGFEFYGLLSNNAIVIGNLSMETKSSELWGSVDEGACF